MHDRCTMAPAVWAMVPAIWAIVPAASGMEPRNPCKRTVALPSRLRANLSSPPTVYSYPGTDDGSSGSAAVASVRQQPDVCRRRADERIRLQLRLERATRRR